MKLLLILSYAENSFDKATPSRPLIDATILQHVPLPSGSTEEEIQEMRDTVNNAFENANISINDFPIIIKIRETIVETFARFDNAGRIPLLWGLYQNMGDTIRIFILDQRLGNF